MSEENAVPSVIEYSEQEEKANTITHGIGFLLALIAFPVLLYKAGPDATDIGYFGLWVYGLSLLLCMASSTIYHTARDPKTKVLLKKLDHISIYFLIAGTYTALILNRMNFQEGLYYLYGLWGMALLGILFKVMYVNKFKVFSTLIYVLMGYIMLLNPWMFLKSLSKTADIMLICGGFFYTVGAGFYLWKSKKWTHTIWHILVMLGAGSHFAAFLYELS
jgi:hemolysin III